MIKRALAATTLALAGAAALAPTATADDYIDPTGPYDATHRFIAPWEPGAFTEHTDKGLILSPHGNTGLQCHGFRNEIWDCTQTVNGAVHKLIPIITNHATNAPMSGVREIWVFPFDTGSLAG
ncbi:hypothetical protein ABEU20_000673 [Rhodococcus sp. PAM 2766]|uniref:Uncharacterized protein n=1 Tax=Rhodococcus parequi TaxID=3137122 RepID=A0ABW9F9D4_9NOCA